MRHLNRSLFGLIIVLFLSSTIGVATAFAQIVDPDAPPPPPASDQATITIRDGATVISSGSATLPDIGSPDVAITSIGGSHNVPARSVLAIIKDIESATTTFSISDLQYSDAYSSFYLNCIAAPADPASPLCGNWQYVVNGTSPNVGMEVQTLSNNDAVYLYFGPSRRITPSSSNVTIGVPFTVAAESYVAPSNSWTPATGLTLRILQGDPFNSPTIISSATVGADGKATFTIHTAGSYAAGLLEDGYYPNASITASATPQASLSSSGGGGGGINLHAPFDMPLALAYLQSEQRADGSFSSALLSDWVAIALGGGGAGDAQKKLSQYFSSNPPSLQSVSDYERHAMALEALGINPYSGTSVDYITPIVNGFDGKQIGDAALVNDDIFAIFPLLHAGYSTNDDVIQRVVLFILSKQLPNGSWENSEDLTAAAVQALSLARQLPDTSNAINSAIDYIHGKLQADASLGNSFATSWSLQAIAAAPSSSLNWANGYYTPQYYIATLQERDGGIEPASATSDTRVWATAYAIPAIQGNTWDSLLSSFAKPAPKVNVEQIATSTPVTTAEAVSVAPTSSVAVELSNAEKLPDEEKQETFVEPELPAPAEPLATSTEATTTLANVSPPYVQTAAIAVVDYGIPTEWKWWLALLVLLAFIAGLWRGFRKRKQR
ncbi:MAG: hypothetical protein Q7S01_00105 [bacterium]|nr:hypothetical protein [bacterium]